MRNHLFGAALAIGLTLVGGQQPAHAEIYTYIDAQGRTNVSNLTPPDGARITSVVHEAPPRPNPHADAAREAARQADVAALSQRVEQLQYALDSAARQPPPPPQYVMVPAPMPMAPPPQQYAADAASAQYQDQDCPAGWSSCTSWWNPAFAPIVVVPSARRGNPAIHWGHPGRGNNRGPMQRPPMKTAAFGSR
jgi:hypothetical protein